MLTYITQRYLGRFQYSVNYYLHTNFQQRNLLIVVLTAIEFNSQRHNWVSNAYGLILSHLRLNSFRTSISYKGMKGHCLILYFPVRHNSVNFVQIKSDIWCSLFFLLGNIDVVIYSNYIIVCELMNDSNIKPVFKISSKIKRYIYTIYSVYWQNLVLSPNNTLITELRNIKFYDISGNVMPFIMSRL